jgi:uncharacterized membrane protein YjgN (DUF898 family)
MSEEKLETSVKGARVDLFGLVLKTGALMVATLGLYSFWARTRLRRWLWSSVRPGGMPLEYTGQPLEKLVGFFVAAVLLVFYVGLVMMLILFASLNVLGDTTPGFLVAIALVLPLYFIAQYRGRRYLVNHTSWRGLGFSMQAGAFGYMWRAFFYYGLAIVSAGLLLPLATFRLRKYMVDRTSFGDQPFFQDGRFTMLYPAFLPYLVFGAASIGLPVADAVIGGGGNSVWLFLTIPGLILSWIYYRVASFRILMSNTLYSGGTELEIFPRTGKIIKIHLVGNLIIFLILSLVVPILVAMLLAIFSALGAGFPTADILTDEFSLGALFNLPEWAILSGSLLIYFSFFVLRAQFKHVFVTFPMLRHAAETLVVHDATVISATRRGKDQHMADADGLAGFFDFGGSI